MATDRDKIIWSNVERLLSEKEWSLVDLANRMGIKPQGVNSLKSGIRGIGTKSTEKLAKALGVEVIELYKTGIPDVFSRPIPVISWVHAGAFSEPADLWPVGISGEGESVFSRRKVGPHAFGLRIEGDSMAPRYLPGDIVIIDPERRCDNGSACVVWINGDVSLKLFYEDENEVRLVPLNETHEISTIPKGRKVDFRVIGKVVDMIPRL